ncbi:40s ribosomal protein s10 [Phaffia rhodozyma]|uniref:40s ribosomal protein s10 n=1 Tax=Phaffia rhodozyma TaxID=264483 RepID=A0A0F7SJT0_PHARH|nr:40s ribosomal protein s10 [Phaffia rhodozyma]
MHDEPCSLSRKRIALICILTGIELVNSEGRARGFRQADGTDERNRGRVIEQETGSTPSLGLSQHAPTPESSQKEETSQPFKPSCAIEETLYPLPATSGLSNMLISKQNRRAIFENLFKEGVAVAAKDFNAATHPEIEGVSNLEVIKAMQSLTSKGYVKTQFSWQYYYYTLTPEGLDYLREFLHLPSEIVPNTLKRPTRPAKAQGPGGAYRAPRAEGAGRGEYRRREDGAGAFGAGRGGPRA